MSVIMLVLSIFALLVINGSEYNSRTFEEKYGGGGSVREAELQEILNDRIDREREFELLKDKDDLKITDEIVKELFRSCPDLKAIEQNAHDAMKKKYPQWVWGYYDEKVHDESGEADRMVADWNAFCKRSGSYKQVEDFLPSTIKDIRRRLYRNIRLQVHCARHGMFSDVFSMRGHVFELFDFIMDDRTRELAFSDEEVTVETRLRICRTIKQELRVNGVNVDFVVCNIGSAHYRIITTNYYRWLTTGKNSCMRGFYTVV